MQQKDVLEQHGHLPSPSHQRWLMERTGCQGEAQK